MSDAEKKPETPQEGETPKPKKEKTAAQLAKEERKKKAQEKKAAAAANPKPKPAAKKATRAPRMTPQEKAELHSKMEDTAEKAMAGKRWRPSYTPIAYLLDQARSKEFPENEITACGWVRTFRKSGKGLGFIELNDGSSADCLQCIVEAGNFSEESKADYDTLLEKVTTGSCIYLTGKLVASPAAGQLAELKISAGGIHGDVNQDKYPLAKAALPLEHLRTVPHLRIRTAAISCVARIRNTCAYAIHTFFQRRGFKYVHTPILTANDCEGAGECFNVTTSLTSAVIEGKEDLPRVEKSNKVDTAKDFFGRQVMLTVSGQLNVETYCAGLTNVYTFGPTFRAEESYTTRHLAEFWMIEPEMWFASLDDIANIAEDFVKFVVGMVLRDCQDDLIYLDGFQKRVYDELTEEEQAVARASGGGLVERLTSLVTTDFLRIPYSDAIESLKESVEKDGVKFNVAPEWGIDMGSEHERFLCEQKYKRPLVVTDFPTKIKSFYMKQNPDGKTVQAMDILVPGIGEMIGGSAREDNLEKLEANMDAKGIPKEGLSWYLDLRRFGSAPHAGFGLGFERMLLLVTGMANIRDVIPFPRWPKHCQT
eukprot:TRINITY_DN67478_c3_g2_i4.p1 TRINITY_DN67478_c3_g2~~TRINITY_DN67478_c3_g2_i4.p1  ORF type:complete len:606 (+),score=95.28 TRINITY_DN67478_c3_g2_i4:38-1819(+)